MTPTRNSTISIPRARWLTHAAFVLALIVVIARVTTLDALRDPWEATPGGSSGSHGPGPATALIYDLLLVVPALLVLIRRAIDIDFRLAIRWSHGPMFLLGIWAVLSTAWSADKFAAAVTSAHLLASACLLWAVSQLVRSWVRFRLVSAVTFGLLLLLVAQSLMYRYVDVPETQGYWNEKKTEILQQHGWAPESFSAKQFEHKVLSGETGGFFASPNTLAAVGVLLFAACVGIGIQKILDGEDRQWLALPITAAVGLIWILVQAGSKTAAATPFVGISIIAIFWAFRDRLRGHSTAAYVTGVVLVFLGLAAVAGIGVLRHGLFPGHFSNSLDFRWKYWVASAGIFAGHPIVGVGWSNFGYHYLAHRLPEAAEEIKDPHNFLVRFVTELGLVGGLLLMTWLLRVAWEITRPAKDSDSPTVHDDDSATIVSPVIAVIIGMLVSTFASTDFSEPALDTMALLLRPLLLFLAMLLGTMAASMLDPHTLRLDARPAPWIFYCTVVGLALFLLHNLIDFSWFEPGPMAAFMMLIGASLGIARAPDKAEDIKTPVSEILQRRGPAAESTRAQTRRHDRVTTSDPARRIVSIATAITAVAAWLVAAAFFVTPVIIAEETAAAANDSVNTASKEQSSASAAHYHRAADLLASAAATVPYNAEYPFRQAKASLNCGDLAAAELQVTRAKQVNPFYIDAYLLDANLQLKAEPRPDVERVRSDFDTMLRLNPNDVSFHVQYAEALDRFGKHSEAARQYNLAIEADAALPEGEPKRLSSEELTGLREHLRQD